MPLPAPRALPDAFGVCGDWAVKTPSPSEKLLGTALYPSPNALKRGPLQFPGCESHLLSPAPTDVSTFADLDEPAPVKADTTTDDSPTINGLLPTPLMRGVMTSGLKTCGCRHVELDLLKKVSTNFGYNQFTKTARLIVIN